MYVVLSREYSQGLKLRGDFLARLDDAQVYAKDLVSTENVITFIAEVLEQREIMAEIHR